jgi:two-component system LytT family response regulator
MEKIKLVGKTTVTSEAVIYLRAESNYSEVYLTSGKVIILSKTLKKLETVLQPMGFFRTHKSFLVNLKHVVSSSVYDEQDQIHLSNNHKVDLSRRRKNEFKEIRRRKLL